MPSIDQQIALRFSPAPKYPAAALKQRIALVHPLAQAAGLLNILKIRIVVESSRWIRFEGRNAVTVVSGRKQPTCIRTGESGEGPFEVGGQSPPTE
jgi:hypothetical protein